MNLGMWRTAVLVSLSVAAFGAVAQTAARPVRIGFACPLTGPAADFGISSRLGAELAVKEINEVGGYLGRPLELVVRDDQAKPDVGRAIAEELVLKEKVDFTIAYCNTGVAVKSLDVYQDHQHLLMVPVATGTAITAKYPGPESFIFHLSPPDAVQAEFMVEDLVQRRGLRKIALFADKTGYGQGGLQDMQKYLGLKGLKPVYVANFDVGVKSLAQEMREAKAAGAEAFVGYALSAEQIVLAKARAEAGFTGPHLGPWTLSFRSVWEQAGPAAEGAMPVQTIIQDLSNERRATFMARLKRHAGDQEVRSLMAAAECYDAVNLMLRAVFQTRGDTAGPALKAALEDLARPYAGVVTSYDKPFSKTDHDAVTLNMLSLGVWRKGELHFYYPEDAKRASYIRRKAG